MLLESQKKAYLPHVEWRLLSAIYELAYAAVYYIEYKRYFDSIKIKLDSSNVWYTYTVNAYYDSAIFNWCKLFGSYSEPTHYYQLLSTPLLKEMLVKVNINLTDRTHLKRFILNNCSLSIIQFDKYHKLVKDYRDKNLIHREHSPTKINDGDLSYPILGIAKKTVFSLISLVIKIARTFPQDQSNSNFYSFQYHDLSKPQINKIIKQSIPPFILNGVV